MHPRHGIKGKAMTVPYHVFKTPFISHSWNRGSSQMSLSLYYLEKAVAKICGAFRSCRKYILKIPTRLWNLSYAFWISLWRGELDEKENVVLRKHAWSALWRCWPHLVTLSATTSVAYLNIAGYFVGQDFQGDPSRNYQALYQLCLQVTAKILVNS